MARRIQVAVSKDRFVVLHYHIFKNAGSTFDYILQRNFREGFVEFHGVHDDATVGGEDIVQLVRSDLSIRAVTSHHLRYPRPQDRGTHFIDACFIRHPLDRIRSIYHYGRKQDPASWLGGLCRAHDEAGFVAHLVEHLPVMVNDVQTNFLANAAFYARPTGQVDFDAACAILDRVCALGVVDMFDQSMVAMEHFLRPTFPELSMEYVRQNVSAPKPRAVAAGPESMSAACREAWGDTLYDRVSALNAWDLRLYARARDEVSRRFALVPDAQARLDDYRARCVALAPPPPAPAPAAEASEPAPPDAASSSED